MNVQTDAKTAHSTFAQTQKAHTDVNAWQATGTKAQVVMVIKKKTLGQIWHDEDKECSYTWCFSYRC